MINLLPPQHAAQLHYGRHNAILGRWLMTGLLACAGLALIIFSGLLYIDQQTKDLRQTVTGAQAQLQAQELVKVQKEAEKLSSNIKVINQVLRLEIRFSDLIQEVGKVMPPGTILGSLTLNKLTGAIDLSASAKDYASAARIATNLSDPQNKIFDKVDIINLTCTSGDDVYKCSGTYKALFSKTLPNRFLNVPESSKP